MFCCFEPWSDPKNAYEQQTSDGISGFPGQRRDFVKTDGNALAAVPQEDMVCQPQDIRQPENLHQQQTSVPPRIQPQEQQDQGELVAVTVPEGVYPGQMIQVRHPDGSGRLIGAQIPEGMSAGSKFYVRAPPRKEALPPPVASPVIVTAPLKSPHPPSSPPMPMAHAEPLHTYSNVPAVEPPAPFSQCLDTPGDVPAAHQMQHSTFHKSRPAGPPSPETLMTAPLLQSPPHKMKPSNKPNTNNNNTSLLRVNVPPGVTPGSTILVQVPGENRKISATVPPNCSEFHVQYQPQKMSSNHTTPSQQAPPYRQQQQQQQKQQRQQKLLKVSVPPGSGPGDFLHVQVPGEPGRLVQAQIPPGNVREFNVAYEPRTPKQQQQQQPQQYHHHHQHSAPYHNNNNNNNYNGHGGGDDNCGTAALPIAGGLATAAAGAMVYEHFAHH